LIRPSRASEGARPIITSCCMPLSFAFYPEEGAAP